MFKFHTVALLTLISLLCAKNTYCMDKGAPRALKAVCKDPSEYHCKNLNNYFYCARAFGRFPKNEDFNRDYCQQVGVDRDTGLPRDWDLSYHMFNVLNRSPEENAQCLGQVKNTLRSYSSRIYRKQTQTPSGK